MVILKSRFNRKARADDWTLGTGARDEWGMDCEICSHTGLDNRCLEGSEGSVLVFLYPHFLTTMK